MEKSMWLKNISVGPWKIKFKENTPHFIKLKIKNVLRSGDKIYIPTDVLKFINIEFIELSKARREIATRELEEMEVVPIKKIVPKKPKKPSTSSSKKKKAKEIKKKETLLGSGEEEDKFDTVDKKIIKNGGN